MAVAGEEWPTSAPLILGWTGLLEHVRFAVGTESGEAWLWFGA
ncbi:MAG: hypothetical protein U0234_06855 [Sandaracinus sp.]